MPDLAVGGQAVIEGVMMRSDDRIATAVRIPSGEIKVKTEPFISLTKKHKILGVPIIRGAVSFIEMLVVGIKSLNFSGFSSGAMKSYLDVNGIFLRSVTFRMVFGSIPC